MKTLILAEPGSTHEGDYDMMIRLVKAAASAGADCFKNQWTSDAETMCARRHAPEYLDNYRTLQYPLAWHARLREVCREYGMAYGCTTYIPRDPAMIAPFVDYLKVSSFEASNAYFVGENLRLGVAGGPKIIISFGMSRSYALAFTSGMEYQQPLPYALLHCCSAYPAPISSLNLRAMPTGARPSKPGFSDHSRDLRAGAWAVCAGAEVIETHVRLDDCDPAHKDYAVAFTPAELKLYVQNIRDAELALGDGVKRVQQVEEPMLKYRVLTG